MNTVAIMLKRSRVQSSPTLMTPVRAQKRAPLREIVEEVGETRMQLTYESDESRSINWSNDELKALVEFILFNGKGDVWPTHHRMDFWSSAAGFIKMRSNTSNQRSSNYIFRCYDY